jgi:hypothetical protein
MGAMKNIAIDVMDLQYAACQAADEEAFLLHISQSGWVSPTEQEGRAYQASKMIAELSDSERLAVERVLDAVGVNIPTVDFPIRTLASANN